MATSFGSPGRIGVIGGGLGGLAAACTLAARGHAVTCSRRTAGSAARRPCWSSAATASTWGRPSSRCRRCCGASSPRPVATWTTSSTSSGSTRSGAASSPMARPSICREPRAMAASSSGSPPARRRGLPRLDRAVETAAWHLRATSSSGAPSKTCATPDRHAPASPADVARRARAAHGPVGGGEHPLARPDGAWPRCSTTSRSTSARRRSSRRPCSAAIAHMQTEGGVWYPRGGTAPCRGARTAGPISASSCDGGRHPAHPGTGTAACTVSRPRAARPFAWRGGVQHGLRSHARELLEGDATESFRGRSGPALRAGVLGRRALPGAERERYEHLLHHNFVFSPIRRRSSSTSTARASRRRTRRATCRGALAPNPRGPAWRRGALRSGAHALPAPHHDWREDASPLPPRDPRQAEDCRKMPDIESRIVVEER
jgi:diapolycopene oxygenase